MKRLSGLTAVIAVLLCSACGVTSKDSGPTKTTTQDIDAGNAETVQAEIRMNGGELKIDGSGSKLLSATFRHSESIEAPNVRYEVTGALGGIAVGSMSGRHAPNVRYDVTGASGRLSVASPKDNISLHGAVNEWDLHLGTTLPVELLIALGGGKADIDVSKVPLKSLEVQLGGGDLTLNVAGSYGHDITAKVTGGAGSMKIVLPKNMGAAVDAKMGIGGVTAHGLTERDGKYYNDSYAEGKPALHMEVRGGAGDIELSIGD